MDVSNQGSLNERRPTFQPRNRSSAVAASRTAGVIQEPSPRHAPLQVHRRGLVHVLTGDRPPWLALNKLTKGKQLRLRILLLVRSTDSCIDPNPHPLFLPCPK